MLDSDYEYVEEITENVTLQPVDKSNLKEDIGHSERLRLRRVIRTFHSLLPVGRGDVPIWQDSNGRLYREVQNE